MSLPAPEAMPTDRASVVAVLEAREIPAALIAASTATVVASEVAMMSPVLRITLSPSPASMPLAAAAV